MKMIFVHFEFCQMSVMNHQPLCRIKVNLAEQVPRQGYAEVIPEAFNVEYSVNRLPASLIDVNENPVRNNTTYVAAILVVGKGNLQLSEFSAPFSLLNQSIYNGFYAIHWKATIQTTSLFFHRNLVVRKPKVLIFLKLLCPTPMACI